MSKENEVKVFVLMIYDDISYLRNVVNEESRLKDKSIVEITKLILERISIISNTAKATLER